MSVIGKHILIIDEDAENLKNLRKIFEGIGMSVTEAIDLEGGLIAMEETVPHVITLDFLHDGESGHKFLEEKSLKGNLKNIPVLMISKESNSKQIAKSLSLGASDYALKPIVARDILQKIRKIIRNSEKTVGTYEFKGELPVAKLYCHGEVVSINEISCHIKSPIKLSEGTGIQIKSELFKKLDLENCRHRTVNESRSSGVGLYSTEITFVGIDETIAKKIRTFQRKRA